MATDLTRPPTLEYSQPSFRGCIGISRRDITPPSGIYARNFAFLKDGLTTTGTHRPLNVTAAVFKGVDRGSQLILVSADGSWFKDPKDEEKFIRGPVMSALNLPASDLVIAYSHTHSGPSLSSSESDCPGGQHVLPYMQHVSLQILEAIREADTCCRPATLTWATGRCNLAVNRDQVDPEAARKRFIVGYDPEAPADDTLLVGRITNDDDQSIVGIIMNYACHPITFGWQNRMASPDYVGVARELVEAHTGGAPCLFLQGCSGELAPRRQYTGEHSIVQSNGNQLGYAALSTLESMLKPGHLLRFDSVVESGAPLGFWMQKECDISTAIHGACISVRLPLKKRPSLLELQQKIAQCQDLTLRERLRRDLRIGSFVGEGSDCAVPAWVWRLGSSLLIAHPNEAYSNLQLDLRRAFPEFAVAAVNVANGWCGYLPPKNLYDFDIYQAWQTPFAPGGLEMFTAATNAAARDMVSRG